MTEWRNWEDVRNESLAAMSPEQRRIYDRGYEAASARLELAQVVYDARVAAGLSKRELASLAGTKKSVIADIEEGGNVPGEVALIASIAHALGRRVTLAPIAA